MSPRGAGGQPACESYEGYFSFPRAPWQKCPGRAGVGEQRPRRTSGNGVLRELPALFRPPARHCGTRAGDVCVGAQTTSPVHGE